MNHEHNEDQLLAKIRRLPPEKLAAVEYFVDFLSQREADRRLAQAATTASETALAEVWDNPDDAEYDRLEFGDVVLVRFPFSDHGTVKQRPAAVISSAAYHQVRPDVLIMAISSQIRPWSPFAEPEIRHWKSAGLLKPSVLKPVVATIERSLIRRTLVIFVRLISTRCAPS